jgi:hypothetical protein
MSTKSFEIILKFNQYCLFVIFEIKIKVIKNGKRLTIRQFSLTKCSFEKINLI